MKFSIYLNRHVFEISPAVTGNVSVNSLGPVFQSIVSLKSSLRVISLTVLADSRYNILIFFAEKKCE